MRLLISSLAAVVLLGSPSLLAQSPKAETDRLIGKWVLDPSKSTFKPGPGPVGDIRTYVRGPNGLVATIQRRFRDGRSQQIEYIAEYDREYPVTGTDEYDHLLLKRVDEYTAEAVLSHGDKVYGSARRRISPDGKTMTITFTRNLGGAGVPITNVSVYEKSEELSAATTKGLTARAPGPFHVRRVAPAACRGAQRAGVADAVLFSKIGRSVFDGVYWRCLILQPAGVFT